MSRIILVLTVSAGLLGTTSLAAQTSRPDSDRVPVLEQRELDGPRVGVAWISGSRAMAKLNDLNLRPVMSLFGWHFEQVTRPQNGGPSFVVQQVLLVAGLDQGTAIPSGTLLVGVRLANGLEFGMGPNVSPVGAALAVGVGKSLRYGGVTIPVNVGFVMSQGAMRTSFLVGYAIRRR